MLKSVTYPDFIRHGITPNHRAFTLDKNLRVFGCDTETLDGEPWTVQAHDGQDTLFAYVNERTVFKRLIDWLASRAREGGVNLAYFHNLKFDIPILFAEKRDNIFEQVNDISFTYKGWEIKMLFGKINTFEARRGDCLIKFVDSFAFTTTSLEKSLKMFGCKGRKMEHPKHLGEKPLKDAYFEQYSKNDAVIQYELALKILDFHKKYTVRPSISLPQFSARVFRHHFFLPDETIQFPPKEVVKASELSYHGGKNGFYLPKRSIIEDCYEGDISSAYPYAMQQLPQFVKGAYKGVSKYDPENVGIYRVTGWTGAKYPIIFDHSFKPVEGEFKDTWITGFELACALKDPNVEVKKSVGYVWVPDKKYKHNALAEYVEHFYKLKCDTPKEDPNYWFYKIMLNSLYGKFVQAVELREMVLVRDGRGRPMKIPVDFTWDRKSDKLVMLNKGFKAGGLYNPFVGTQVTGFVRAMLLGLEKKYSAFHSATDSIKTTKKITPVNGLGGFNIVTFGRCYVFRNKLYLHYAKSNKHCGHDLKNIKLFDADGQHLCKYGLHGFKARVEVLHENRHKLMRDGELAYSYRHMVGLREGTRRREKICAMTQRSEILRVSGAGSSCAVAEQAG